MKHMKKGLLALMLVLTLTLSTPIVGRTSTAGKLSHTSYPNGTYLLLNTETGHAVSPSSLTAGVPTGTEYLTLDTTGGDIQLQNPVTGESVFGASVTIEDLGAGKCRITDGETTFSETENGVAFAADSAQSWQLVRIEEADEPSAAQKTAVAEEAALPEAVQMATGSAVAWGIDVSTYQGTINWTSVKNSGVDFAIIRIGYGSSYSNPITIDSKFYTNISGAIAAGVDVGIYLYSYAVDAASAASEASNVITVLNSYRGQISYPIFMDVEDTVHINAGVTQTTAAIRAFTTTMKNAGWYGAYYSYLNFCNNYFNRSSLTDLDFWIAAYGANDGARHSFTFSGTYTMWQYTSKGLSAVSGIGAGTGLDLNDCYVDYPSIIQGGGWNGYSATPQIGLGDFTHAYITNGAFVLTNHESGRCLNVPGNSDTSLTALSVSSRNYATGQTYNFVRDSNGYYTMSPACSPTGKVVNVNGSTSQNGNVISIYAPTGDDTQQWVYEKTSAGYYVIHSVDNPTYVLAEMGTSDSSAIKLETYTGNANQLWNIAFADDSGNPIDGSAVTYTVSYNPNNGTGAPAAQTTTGSVTLSSVIPMRSGYTFLGWSTSSTATSASYQAGETITVRANTTLYAVWQVATPMTVNLSFGSQVNFGSNVLTFTVNAASVPSGATDVYAQVSHTDMATGSRTATVTRTGLTASNGYYSYTCDNLGITDMRGMCYTTFRYTYGGIQYTSQEYATSVEAYCLGLLAGSETNTVKALAADYLNYGAAAQVYYGVATGTLANANLGAYGAYATQSYRPMANVLSYVAGTTGIALDATADFQNGIGIVYSVPKAALAAQGITINTSNAFLRVTRQDTGATVDLTLNDSDGTYNYFRYALSDAGDYAEVLYATLFCDGIAVTKTRIYSVESYLTACAGDSDANAVAFAKAFRKYAGSLAAYNG